jgi:hypothetical protein
MDLWFLYINPAELPATYVMEQGGVPPVVVVQPAVYGNYTNHGPSSQTQSEPVYATAEYRECAKANPASAPVGSGSGSGYAPVAQRVEVVSDYHGSSGDGVVTKPGNTVVDILQFYVIYHYYLYYLC